MAHLTPARLVDLAEGTEPEYAVPHLGECDACRRSLAALRATMADVASLGDSAVPEPSPLFWDHLSTRVRSSVAEHAPGGTRWVERWLRPRVVLPILVGVAGAVLVAVATSRRPVVQTPIPATPLPTDEALLVPFESVPSLQPLAPFGAADDPSLGLMADYGTTLGWDEMREEMAVAPRAGVVRGADEAVIALSAEERQELLRLLEEEMTQPSALGTSS